MPNETVYYAMQKSEYDDLADAVREVLGISGAIKGSEIADYIRQTASLDALYIQDSLARINYEFPTALFKGNTKIQKVVIGDNVTAIPAEAFQNCTNLKEVVIGSGVTSIGNTAFSGCTKLKTVKGCQNVQTIGSSAFQSAGNFDETGEFTPLTIEGMGNVTNIGGSAFQGCTKLTTIGSTANEVNLPSLTSMGQVVFDRCSSIISISMPSLLIIPDLTHNYGPYQNHFATFKDCTSLQSANFRDLITIGSMAFAGCTSLESITGISNVTTLNGAAFYNCQSLSSISLPQVRIIPDIYSYSQGGSTSVGVFQNCNSLTSVTLNPDLETIGSYAFNSCTALQTINIPENVTSIRDNAFENCSTLTTVSGCQNVKTIGHYTFQRCTALTTIGSTANEVNLPNLGSLVDSTNYGTIGVGAFDNCSSIISILLPSLLSIPDGAGSNVYSNTKGTFKDCTSLRTVTFSVLTSIGNFAFTGCTSLEMITGLSNVTNIGIGSFYNCRALQAISLPLVTSVPSRWNSTGGNPVRYDVFYECLSLTSVSFGSALTSIGSYAFNGCTALQTITIPENVTSIGDYCFNNCSNLETIILLRTTAITTATGSHTFDGCTKLRNNSGENAHIYVPSSLLSSYNVNYWNVCSDKLTAYEVTMTIDGTTYTFNYGPLFDEWCTTHTDFVVSGNNILTNDKTKYLALNGNAVFPTDHAIGNSYTTVAI